jgi:hypothetical protein
LQSIRPLRPKDEDCPREWIFAERLTHQRRKPIASLSKIYRLDGHQNPYAGRNRDHDAASTARGTVCKVAASMPGAIRNVAAPITISIDGGPPGHADAIGISARGPASTITGVNPMPPLPAPFSAWLCASRRHPNNSAASTRAGAQPRRPSRRSRSFRRQSAPSALPVNCAGAQHQ